MEKKSLLGILLILLILFLYPYYLSLFVPKEEKIVKTIEFPPSEAPHLQDIEFKKLNNYDTVHDTVIKNKYLWITCSNRGAGIKMIRLIRLENQKEKRFLTIYETNNYDKNLLFFSEPFLNFDLNNSIYHYEEREGEVRYTLTIPEQFFLEKFLSLQEDSHLLKFTLRIKNLDSKPLPFNFNLLGLENLKSKEPLDERYWEIAYPHEGKIKHEPFHKLRYSKLYLAPLSWLALKSKYFCQIMIPSSSSISFLAQPSKDRLRVFMQIPLTILQPGETKEENFLLYFGPLDMEVLNRYNNKWREIVNFGTFDGIAKLILKILKISFDFFKNYGLAIIFLSFLANLFLFPFTWKSIKSMRALQSLQPKIEELRKLYGKDPQRLNKEIFELYRKQKVNPLGGCLPLLLQMPVFVALYQVLVRALELKGAKFLWIKDLSLPDALFTFPERFLFLDSFNLLPILMVLSMYLQQKKTQIYSPSQRQPPWLMPLFFGLLFYNFPSGLLLYWLTSTCLNLILQVSFIKER